MNERTKRLKDRVFDYPTALCPERARWLTEAYRNSEGEPTIIRRAKGFKNILEKMKIYIGQDELVVGNFASAPRSAPIFPEFGVKWIQRELDWLPERPLESFQVSEEVRQLVPELVEYWDGKTHEDYAKALLKETLPEKYHYAFNWESYSMNQVISCAGHISTGDGHIIANYNRVITEGLQPCIDIAQKKIREMDEEPAKLDIEKKMFYRAVILCAEGLIH